MSIYVLDTDVVVLAGGDLIEQLGSMIDYKRNVLIAQNYSFKEVKIQRVTSKHRMIDIPALFQALE